MHGGAQLRGGGDHAEIRQATLQRLNGLGGGVVGNAQPNARVFPVERPHLLQQQNVQGRLAGVNGQAAGLQRGDALQFVFPSQKLFLSDGNVGVQGLAFGGQGHAAGAAHQQLAAQLFLQPVQGAGHIGLAHL